MVPFARPPWLSIPIAGLCSGLFLGGLACNRRETPTQGASVKAEPPAAAVRLFTDIAQEAGLNFVHFNGATGVFRFPEIMGAGCALLDYDNDGDLDVYAVQGAWLVAGRAIFPPAEGETLTDHLYRNDTAPGKDGRPRVRFTDVTVEAGVGEKGYGMGCAVGDYDSDGHADLYVTNFGPNVLYHNNGDGTFTDVTAASGTRDGLWSTSASFLDYDADGFLDLFVAHYVEYTLESLKVCINFHTGAPDYCVPSEFRPVMDRLYHNRADGTFEDVTVAGGIDKAFGNGLGVLTGDYNADGRIDIFVANDVTANQMWLNSGDGTFRDAALPSGTAVSGEGLPQGNMGIVAGDIEGDGDEDIFITHFVDEPNILYRAMSPGLFNDATFECGVGFPSLPFTGFGTAMIDYDNDGRLDIFVTNGAVLASERQLGQPFPYAEQSHLYRNVGGRFELAELEADSPLRVPAVGRGTALGDIDNDGDQDLLVSSNSGPLRLLRNEVGQNRAWAAFRLVGTKSNRDALGAVVRLPLSEGEVLMRRVARDGSYCSANDVRVHFGLGERKEPVTVRVSWPSGLNEQWTDVPINRETELTEGQGLRIEP